MKNSMLQYIKGIFKFMSKKESLSYSYEKGEDMPLNVGLEENLKLFQECFKNSDDYIVRRLHISTKPNLPAAIIFLDSIIDKNTLINSVINPLIQGLSERPTEERAYVYKEIEALMEGGVVNSNTALKKSVQEVVDELLCGKGVLLIDKHREAISLSISRNAVREFAEPNTEKVVKGPQQGFVEDIMVNISILRKNIKSPNLVLKKYHIGKETKTETWVVYLANIADESIVEELNTRLGRINTDGILGSSQIEEYICDSPSNIFRTTFFTERPDRLQAMLLEGRIGIMCDGTPFVTVIPAIISDFFISSEDYYINPYFATFNRILRYVSSSIVLFLPSIYIAISTFHQEMIPTRLALTLAGTRVGVPYPAFVEAFMMEIALETLREAGTRLPTYIGQTIGIVGALIIGQAAVEAGLVSPAVVIIVATTAIFSFTLPFSNFSLSLRIVRFFIMILAATLGIYGVMAGGLIFMLNLFSLRSFGVPFMVPLGPVSLEDMKDWVVRLPQWKITERSKHIVKKNNIKKSGNLKPSPPK